jgi:hypothetical protein
MIYGRDVVAAALLPPVLIFLNAYGISSVPYAPVIYFFWMVGIVFGSKKVAKAWDQRVRRDMCRG